MKSVRQVLILMHKSVLVFVATMVVSNALFAFDIPDSKKEVSTIINTKNEANKKGYGKSLSSSCNTLTLYNVAGTTYEVRSRPLNSDWSKDTDLKNGKELSFPIVTTDEISINGGGNSDDIKINNIKGYIEYKTNEDDYMSQVENIWVNLITWNKREWQLNTIRDDVKKRNTTLLPAVNKNECSITLVKSNDMGRSIMQDFSTLLLVNDSHDIPIQVKIANQWQNEGVLRRNQERSFEIGKIEQISLNGDGASDDIKINNPEGYIELKVDKFENFSAHDEHLWITHVWWNPKMRKWYGTQSMTWINGKKNQILKASFDESKGIVIFTISSK